MDYIKSNKEAWEEAFEHRRPGWCEDICDRLESESFPFLEDKLVKTLKKINIKDKTIAQFCCNNGRELLSVMQSGAKSGVGFDIADNMVAWANEIARKTRINCEFIATNILDIDERFSDCFDLILITIGALTWFRDIDSLFCKVSSCLKKGGKLIIHEMHPMTNMLAVEGDENFDEEHRDKLVHSYFKQEPWVETSGMSYMTGHLYESKTFYSHAHTFASIINALSVNNLVVSELHEYELDISDSFLELNGHGIPLSYILVAEKAE